MNCYWQKLKIKSGKNKILLSDNCLHITKLRNKTNLSDYLDIKTQINNQLRYIFIHIYNYQDFLIQ